MFKKEKLFFTLMQHAITKLLEQNVQKPAVKTVVDQTMPATMSMDPVCSVVLMDITEKYVRIVSKMENVNVDTS